MAMAKAKEVHCMTSNETRNFVIDYSSMLGAGIVLTGTPTITALPVSITLSSKVVNVGVLTLENGDTIPIGEAVQFAATGGTAGVTYKITSLCSTDESPAEELEGEIIVQVD